MPSQSYCPSQPFAWIHSDIWGPSRVNTLTSCRWFISFIDDHTRVSWVYLLKDKSDAANVFKEFYNIVYTQFNERIKMVCTNNGTEYFNLILANFFKNNGILHQSSCIDTPKQNGIANRKNHHLLEVVRSFLFFANVSKYFWGMQSLLHAI